MKNQSIQLIRGFAIIGVFLEHAGIVSLGAWGTSLFLSLSGYCMMKNYNAISLNTKPVDCFNFGINKIKKIYFLHFLTTIICMINIVRINISIGNAVADFELLLCFLANIFLIHAWIPNVFFVGTLNVVSWFLCVSLFAYCLFPIIKKICSKLNGRKSIALIALLICVESIELFAFLLQGNMIGIRLYFWPLYRLIDFVIGCLCWKVSCEHEVKGIFFEILGLLIFVGSILAVKIQIDTHFLTPVYAVFSAFILLLLVNRETLPKYFSPIVKVGDYSGELFLIHYVVVMWLPMILVNYISNKYIMAGLGFGISLILAILYKKIIIIRRSKHERLYLD